MKSNKPKKFNYDSIPDGYYDRILDKSSSLRRFWHYHKFYTVINVIGKCKNKTILDLGCFAGSFLKLLPSPAFEYQVGIDILEPQIKYAKINYENEFRKFYFIKDLDDILNILSDQYFDFITLIEVIEHLNNDEIANVLRICSRLLKPGGHLILTTPNYLSVWPFLEFFINRFSDVKYDEQHITKFNYFNFDSKLSKIYTPLYDEFKPCLKTTSHFLSPLLAVLSFNSAMVVSKIIPPTMWRFPFGALAILKLQKL